MKPLVVPVNFSSCSSCAARYAADLAETIQGEVHLINVVNYPFTASDMVMTEEIY
ncbi:MAG: universal stress protein, partial [Chitinophaga rupis]